MISAPGKYMKENSRLQPKVNVASPSVEKTIKLLSLFKLSYYHGSRSKARKINRLSRSHVLHFQKVYSGFPGGERKTGVIRKIRSEAAGF
jgi:hypothetical protein